MHVRNYDVRQMLDPINVERSSFAWNKSILRTNVILAIANASKVFS